MDSGLSVSLASGFYPTNIQYHQNLTFSIGSDYDFKMKSPYCKVQQSFVYQVFVIN